MRPLVTAAAYRGSGLGCQVPLSRPRPPCHQTGDSGAHKRQCARFRNGHERKGGGGAATWRNVKAAAEAVAALSSGTHAAAEADGVRIHGHCSGIRQGSTATNCCTGSQEDDRERENVSLERSGRVEGHRACVIPKHARARTCIDHVNYRAERGGQRAASKTLGSGSPCVGSYQVMSGSRRNQVI